MYTNVFQSVKSLGNLCSVPLKGGAAEGSTRVSGGPIGDEIGFLDEY